MGEGDLWVSVVIPTLDREKGEKVARAVSMTAEVSHRTWVVVDVEQDRFTKTVNRGLRAIVQEGLATDVLFLNDDVHGFTRGWLRYMQEVLYANPRMGVLGLGELVEHLRPWRTVRFTAFWCALVKWEVFKQVGLLDERMVHFSSDIDYCKRVEAIGYYSARLTIPLAEHVGGASGKLKSLFARDRMTFREKYGESGGRVEI